MGRRQLPNSDRDRYLAEFLSDPEIFEEASFGCHMNRASLRFLSNGQMSVTFNIPPEEVPKALSLRLLARDPLPLLLHVSVPEEVQEFNLRALPGAPE
jgi:hypothetical protein